MCYSLTVIARSGGWDGVGGGGGGATTTLNICSVSAEQSVQVMD